MSMGLRADPTGTSGVISVAGADQVVINNAGNVAATTFTGNLIGNADTATKLSTASGAAPSYSARAWVNFDGTKDTTGAVSTANTNRLIRGSGNVSSVLRLATGKYTVSFTTAMQDVNYAVNITSCRETSEMSVRVVSLALDVSITTGGFTFVCQDCLGTNEDRSVLSIMVMR